MKRVTNPDAQAFRIAAFLEAATWAGLLVGMFLKYVTKTTEVGVQVFGQAHGLVFLAYAALTVVAGIRLRWGWWPTLVALAASVPPMFTLLAERWLHRTGRLEAPADRGARPAAETEPADR
jgi:integral membrane protein